MKIEEFIKETKKLTPQELKEVIKNIIEIAYKMGEIDGVDAYYKKVNTYYKKVNITK